MCAAFIETEHKSTRIKNNELFVNVLCRIHITKFMHRTMCRIHFSSHLCSLHWRVAEWYLNSYGNSIFSSQLNLGRFYNVFMYLLRDMHLIRSDFVWNQMHCFVRCFILYILLIWSAWKTREMRENPCRNLKSILIYL